MEAASGYDHSFNQAMRNYTPECLFGVFNAGGNEQLSIQIFKNSSIWISHTSLRTNIQDGTRSGRFETMNSAQVRNGGAD
eukprot:1159980-Pelagomonas_calceolata.AAC.6